MVDSLTAQQTLSPAGASVRMYSVRCIRGGSMDARGNSSRVLHDKRRSKIGLAFGQRQRGVLQRQYRGAKTSKDHLLRWRHERLYPYW